MKLVAIDSDHHVVRHCKRRLSIRKDGHVVGVHPEFFWLRPAKDGRQAETYLSAVYFEFFDGQDDQLQKCADAMPVVVNKGEAVVKLNAGAMRSHGQSANRPLRIVHEASHQTVPSKARILGLPVPPLSPDEALCAALTGADVVVDMLTVTS